MKYKSEFKVVFSLPYHSDERHIFNLLEKIDKEIRLKFPDVFNVLNLDTFESSDFHENSYSPRTVTLYGNLDTEDPSRFATTKQLLHMALSKYKKRHELNYNIWSSRVISNSDSELAKDATVTQVKLKV